MHTATTPPPRTQLSPITENRGISKNKGNSQQHSNDTNMVLNRLPQVMRNRKTTLTRCILYFLLNVKKVFTKNL